MHIPDDPSKEPFILTEGLDLSFEDARSLYHNIRRLAVGTSFRFVSLEEAAGSAVRSFFMEKFRQSYFEIFEKVEGISDLVPRLEIYLGVRIAPGEDIQAENRALTVAKIPIRRRLEDLPRTPEKGGAPGSGKELNWDDEYDMPMY